MNTEAPQYHAPKRTNTETPSPSQQFKRPCLRTCPDRDSQIISVIQAMARQESNVYRSYDYLLGTKLTRLDRAKMCEWGFCLTEACQMDRNVAIVGITYFDRFLSCRGLTVVEVCLASYREFQLAFIACIIVAVKARQSVNVTATWVTETLCEGMYHPEEFIEMEVQVLRTLGWRLNGPTPRDFILHFMELFPSRNDETVAKKFAVEAIQRSENAVLDYFTALEPPSCIAIASIAAVMRTFDSKMLSEFNVISWMRCIEFVIGSSFDLRE